MAGLLRMVHRPENMDARSGIKNAPTMKQADMNAINSFRKLDSDMFFSLFKENTPFSVVKMGNPIP